MVLFSSSRRGSRPEPGTHPEGGGHQSGLSIIAADLRIEGELRTGGGVRIEGTVVGNVHAEGQVLVAAAGVVHGTIHTAEAILGGKVRGAILAERLELTASSVVQGNITTARLLVREGATVDGHIRMTTQSADSKQSTRPLSADANGIAAELDQQSVIGPDPSGEPEPRHTGVG